MNGVVEVLHDLNAVSTIFRLVLAAILAGIVGMERETHGRVAGFRTHILVGVGSAMAVMVGIYAYEMLSMNTDPLRVGAQVLSGIGFLGAGTILVKSTSKVTGLTTAACLWCMASIGLACGVGFYSAAIAGTGISWITVALLPKIESRRKFKSKSYTYYLEVDKPNSINPILEGLSAGKFYIKEIDILPARSALPGQVGILITLQVHEDLKEKEIVSELLTMAHVTIVLPV
ncbi:MAG: MgtC/SapB family protein [Clostridia bacterium]|nr:MgtC/SapB family protein [Clostridia bacterium]